MLFVAVQCRMSGFTRPVQRAQHEASVPYDEGHRGQGPLLRGCHAPGWPPDHRRRASRPRGAPMGCSGQQQLGDAVGGVAAFGHRGDHQVGAAYGVAAGEQFRVRGLERQSSAPIRHAATTTMRPFGLPSTPCAASHSGTVAEKPKAMMTMSASSNDSLPSIGTALRRPRASGSPSLVSTTRTPVTPSSLAFDRQRRAVEQETHAFLARVGDLARGAGHVGLVAAIGAGHLGRAQTDRAAHAVHAGVAAAEHHHALAVQVGQLPWCLPSRRSAGPRDRCRRRCVRSGPGTASAGSTFFRSCPGSPPSV